MNERENEFAVLNLDGTYVMPNTATKLTISSSGTGTATTMDCRGFTTTAIPYVDWSDLSIATTSINDKEEEIKKEIGKVDKHIDELEGDIEYLAQQIKIANDVIVSQVKQIHNLEDENTRLRVLIEAKANKIDNLEKLLQVHESNILVLMTEMYERKSKENDKMS